MRHFEVPGSGGFLLSTRSLGATALFPEGERGAYFDRPDGCEIEAARYLANPGLRERIAREASLYVGANHTYAHRMRELLALV
jgi:spore maturation protein CgeB